MSLKSTDLRVNNLVLHNGKVIKICCVTDAGIKFYDGKTNSSTTFLLPEEIEPIALIKEQLSKFGYSFQPWGCVKLDSPLIYFSLIPKEKYWIELGNGFKIKIPYVHTLQNILKLAEPHE